MDDSPTQPIETRVHVGYGTELFATARLHRKRGLQIFVVLKLDILFSFGILASSEKIDADWSVKTDHIF